MNVMLSVSEQAPPGYRRSGARSRFVQDDSRGTFAAGLQGHRIATSPAALHIQRGTLFHDWGGVSIRTRTGTDEHGLDTDGEGKQCAGGGSRRDWGRGLYWMRADRLLNGRGRHGGRRAGKAHGGTHTKVTL